MVPPSIAMISPIILTTSAYVYVWSVSQAASLMVMICWSIALQPRSNPQITHQLRQKLWRINWHSYCHSIREAAHSVAARVFWPSGFHYTYTWPLSLTCNHGTTHPSCCFAATRHQIQTSVLCKGECTHTAPCPTPHMWMALPNQSFNKEENILWNNESEKVIFSTINSTHLLHPRPILKLVV